MPNESTVWKYLGPLALAAMLGLAPVLFYTFQEVVMRAHLEKRLEPLEMSVLGLQAEIRTLAGEQTQWKVLESRLTIFQEQLHALRQYLVQQERERQERERE